MSPDPEPSGGAAPVRGSMRDAVSTGRPPLGEAQVWLCSMGLAIGILMIVFLLGLILVRGLEVFWPKRVALVELREGSPAAITDSTRFAGELAQERERTATGGESVLERQYFVGNKDTYGFSFRFVDVADIAAVTYPDDLVVVERLENGDAMFVPVRLDVADGTALASGDEGFDAALRNAVEESSERWSEIRGIEKDAIGALNRRLAKAEQRLNGLRGDPGSDGSEAPSARTAELEAEIADATGRIQRLMEEAAALRERQERDVLTARLPTGQEVAIPAGQILDFYHPNRLGWLQRLGLFFKHFWSFLTEDPREANTEGGIFPAIFGTFVMTVVMSMLVTPFGVIAAIYLREYAKQGLLVQSVRISVNNLAGVPSIVFGVFGLGFFVYFLGGWVDRTFYADRLPTPTFGTGGILWASFTLALLTLPVVIVATEEALTAVPRGVREAALACGASKWQTIQRVVLPSATPGILTGVILAMARGAGEVAPLMLVGVIKLVSELPIDSVPPFVHLDRKFMHLGFHIYDLGFQSPDSEAAKPMVFATTFLLILLVIVMNLAAIMLRNHLRRKYALANF